MPELPHIVRCGGPIHWADEKLWQFLSLKYMSQSFPFTIWSGLLEDGHRQKIGSAVWEFLWCIRKITKEVKNGKSTVGLVLGGKPIKTKDIAQDLHIHPKTVEENLRRLEKGGYIKLIRVPYGQIIEVNNSKRRSQMAPEKEPNGSVRSSQMALSLEEKTPSIYEEHIEIHKEEQEVLIVEKEPNGSISTLTFKKFENTFLDSWNLLCKDYPSLPKILAISDDRRKKLKKRFEFKEFREKILDAIKAIPQYKFLLGENEQGWTVSFDWLIYNNTNFLKILEGRYKDKKKLSQYKASNPSCKLCNGTGFMWIQARGASQICHCRTK